MALHPSCPVSNAPTLRPVWASGFGQARLPPSNNERRRCMWSRVKRTIRRGMAAHLVFASAVAGVQDSQSWLACQHSSIGPGEIPCVTRISSPLGHESPLGCRAASKTPSAKCPDKIRVCGLAAAMAVPWMPPQWQESFSQRCLDRHLHSEVSPIGSTVLPMDTIYWATVHRKH